MFHCDVCGGETAHTEMLSEVFEVDGRMVLVENIPAEVCGRCGEAVLSRETTEHVRKLLHENPKPLKTVPLDVFALATP